MSIYKLPIKDLEEFQKKIFLDSNYFRIPQIGPVTKYEVGFPSLQNMSNLEITTKFLPELSPRTMTAQKPANEIIEFYVGVGKEKHSNIFIDGVVELLALMHIKNNIYGFIEIPSIPTKYSEHKIDEQILKYKIKNSKNKTIENIFIPQLATDYDAPTLQDFISHYDDLFSGDEISSSKPATSFQKRY